MEDAINYAMEWYEKKKKNEDMEAPADKSKTLLEKVGGEEQMHKISKDFYAKVLKDETLAYCYEKIDMDQQIKKFAIFWIGALGGDGKQYIWRDLYKSHVDFALDAKQYESFFKHLSVTLEEYKVDKVVIEILGAIFEKMKNEVVTKK